MPTTPNPPPLKPIGPKGTTDNESAMLFSLPVMMYHSISRHRHRLCVAPELFEEHCRVLAENGWRGVSLAEAEDFFLRREKLPPKSCLFTFDDGYLDNYVYAEPLLRRYGHQGVMFAVANCIETGTDLRPTMEDAHKPEVARELASLDQRPLILRRNKSVSLIKFCNWAEIRRMRERGAMAVAAHSLGHDRVVKELRFTRLATRNIRDGYFGVPPYEQPYGFPMFNLDHALTHRAYAPVPELFDLVTAMVPQDKDESSLFLADEKNRRAVMEAIRALPALAVQESREEYLARIAKDFAECRNTFIRELGVAPQSFCWPWGDYNRAALRAGEEAGFQIFFTTGRGMNLYGRRKAVHRFSVRGGSGLELLEKARKVSLASREFFYSLDTMFSRLSKDHVLRRMFG